jgi:hypothetical protein
MRPALPVDGWYAQARGSGSCACCQAGEMAPPTPVRAPPRVSTQVQSQSAGTPLMALGRPVRLSTIFRAVPGSPAAGHKVNEPA